MDKKLLLKELGFAALAFLSVGLLVFELTSTVDAAQTQLIATLDLGIAGIFLLDFFIGLNAADSKGKFFKERWYEIIAAIPLTDSAIRTFRAIRLIRVVRVIRLAARFKRIADSSADRAASQLFNLWLVDTTIIFAAALAFFDFEYGVNPKVHNLFDAFWWAMVTITTIGYGDIYPITTEGRIVAMALMIVGIGTIGSVVSIASGRFSRRTDIQNR